MFVACFDKLCHLLCSREDENDQGDRYSCSLLIVKSFLDLLLGILKQSRRKDLPEKG